MDWSQCSIKHASILGKERLYIGYFYMEYRVGCSAMLYSTYILCMLVHCYSFRLQLHSLEANGIEPLEREKEANRNKTTINTGQLLYNGTRWPIAKFTPFEFLHSVCVNARNIWNAIGFCLFVRLFVSIQREKNELNSCTRHSFIVCAAKLFIWIKSNCNQCTNIQLSHLLRPLHL